MEIQRRRFLHLAASAAALPAVPGVARAQTFPSRPITIVVGFAAGGPTDTAARILAERMKAALGQSPFGRRKIRPRNSLQGSMPL
jgi:tripartite-type tricarboxylate transporter receptor subunit TctC